MITRRAVLVFFTAAVAALTGCGGSKPSNELVVGMDLSYPPFETIDQSGKPEGVSVELAKALGENLGRPVRIENIPFTGLIPSLQSGKIDCIISSVTDTPERRKSVAFSDPYLTIGLAILASKDSPIQSPADLDQPGRTIAVRQGTTGEVWARAHLKNAKLLSVEKETAAVLEVIQGRADGFLYDQMSVWKNAAANPETTRAILEPVRQEQWAVVLRPGDEELRRQVNEFLAEFRAQGGFDRLGDRFLKEQKDAFRERGIPFYF
ncbi:MAG: transporter substrate-binding domain-containing protein [Terrimicrobiaceae bacterium]|nr:transporter substrate-binding domain-containing protein [Terrimicrobiaceae bacterium]